VDVSRRILAYYCGGLLMDNKTNVGRCTTCCGTPTCPPCADAFTATIPATLYVTFPGVSLITLPIVAGHLGPPCDACETFGGTYALTRIGTCPWIWRYSRTAWCTGVGCNGDSYLAGVRRRFALGITLTYDPTLTLGTWQLQFRISTTVDPTCAPVLPYSAATIDDGLLRSDAVESGATCFLPPVTLKPWGSARNRMLVGCGGDVPDALVTVT